MVLTDEDVAHQRGRQAENDHKHIGHRKIDDEKIGDGAHAGRPVYDGDDKTVADETDHEDDHIRHAVDRRHCHAVPVESIGRVLADRRYIRDLAGVEQPGVDLVMIVHGRAWTRRRDRLRDEVVEVIAEIVLHVQGAGGRWRDRRRGRHVITPASRVNVELVRVR